MNLLVARLVTGLVAVLLGTTPSAPAWADADSEDEKRPTTSTAVKVVAPRARVTPQTITTKAVTSARPRVLIKPRFTRTATARVTSARLTVNRGGKLLVRNVKSYRAPAGAYRVTQIIRYRSATRAKVTSSGQVKVLNWGRKVRVLRHTQAVRVTRTPAPANLVGPRITGTAQPGMALTVSTGTWSGAPTTLKYEWFSNGTLIADSPYKSRYYVPRHTDLGARLSARVTARNAGGKATVRTAEVTVTPPKALPEACPTSTFSDFEAGGDFALVTTPDGTVCGWGENSLGQLGTTTADYRPAATRVQVPKSVSVAAGGRHGLALTANGEVHAWGSNTAGQLGVEDPDLLRAGPAKGSFSPTIPLLFAPRKVDGLPAIASIETWGSTSVAVSRDGSVFVWGESQVPASDGEAQIERVPVPRRLEGLSDIRKVSTDGQRFLALTRDGRLLQWGLWESGFVNDDGTPSDDGGWTKHDYTPSSRAIRKLTDHVVTDIALNGDAAYALTASGRVFGWGSGGGMGRSLPMVAWPDTLLVREPVEFTALPLASSLHAGGSSATAVLRDGTLAYWGEDGGSFTKYSSTPIPGSLSPYQPIERITSPALNPTAIDFGGGWGGALTPAGAYTHLFSEALNEYDGYPFRTPENPRGKVEFPSLTILEAAGEGCSNSTAYEMSSDIPVLLTSYYDYDYDGMPNAPHTSLEEWGVQDGTSYGGATVVCAGTLKVTMTITTTSAWTWAPDGQRWSRTATRKWK